MRKINSAKDMSGREIEKGDTVCTLNGQVSGKIAELAQDDATMFVRLRPVHQPYGPAVWHAADRVLWQADGKKKKQAQKQQRAERAAASPSPKK